jgi:hypothetical protein
MWKLFSSPETNPPFLSSTVACSTTRFTFTDMVEFSDGLVWPGEALSHDQGKRREVT